MQSPPPLLVAPILLLTFLFFFSAKAKNSKRQRARKKFQDKTWNFRTWSKFLGISGQIIFFRNFRIFRTSGTPEFQNCMYFSCGRTRRITMRSNTACMTVLRGNTAVHIRHQRIPRDFAWQIKSEALILLIFGKKTPGNMISRGLTKI